MDSRIQTDILQIIQELEPRLMLVVDDQNPHPHFTGQLKNCVIEHISSDELARKQAGQRYDVALVTNTLEHLEPNEAGILISRLRDLFSRRLLLLVPGSDSEHGADNQRNESDLLAYGLTLLTTYPNAFCLFEYNILNYKSVPDWLNAKHWANPDLWNKYRW